MTPNDEQTTPTSRPNPKRTLRRRHRRFYGLSDSEQRQVLHQQRSAIVAVFDAMEDYFCAELDAKLGALDKTIAECEQDVDAEFIGDDNA